MKRGDLILNNSIYNANPRYLYGESCPLGILKHCTDIEWNQKDPSIVLDYYEGKGSGITALKILTSRGHTGWIQKDWAKIMVDLTSVQS